MNSTPELQTSSVPPQRDFSSMWAVPLLFFGLSIIAACVLVPQVEANRKLAIEREKLNRDLSYIQTQLAVNDEFLKRVGGDAGLAERLAQRQMKQIRKGTAVLKMPGRSTHPDMSPFMLVSIPPPASPAVYQPPAGILGTLCTSGKYQLYVCGLGMFIVACGLVLGASGSRN